MSHRKQTAIVTGSTSGIGLAIARALVDRGDNVVLNGRDPKRLRQVQDDLGAPEQVAGVAGNIGQRRTGSALARTAIERFGSVDILVNNAGTFAPNAFLEVSEEELDGYLQGNLKGTYLTTQAGSAR